MIFLHSVQFKRIHIKKFYTSIWIPVICLTSNIWNLELLLYCLEHLLWDVETDDLCPDWLLGLRASPQGPSVCHGAGWPSEAPGGRWHRGQVIGLWLPEPNGPHRDGGHGWSRPSGPWPGAAPRPRDPRVPRVVSVLLPGPAWRGRSGQVAREAEEYHVKIGSEPPAILYYTLILISVSYLFIQ